MRAIVCGGREYADSARLFKVLDAAVERLGLTEIIQGGAKGADYLAWQWADVRKVPCREFRADWDGQGKAAGAIRNQKIRHRGHVSTRGRGWRVGGSFPPEEIRKGLSIGSPRRLSLGRERVEILRGHATCGRIHQSVARIPLIGHPACVRTAVDAGRWTSFTGVFACPTGIASEPPSDPSAPPCASCGLPVSMPISPSSS